MIRNIISFLLLSFSFLIVSQGCLGEGEGGVLPGGDADSAGDGNFSDGDGGEWWELAEGFDPHCLPPQAPVMPVIHSGALLAWNEKSGGDIQVGINYDPSASEPGNWLAGNSLVLEYADTPYDLKVFAKLTVEDCPHDPLFTAVYNVRESYPPRAGEEGSTAIDMNDPRILSWASGYVEPVNFGEALGEDWKSPSNALGAAEGTVFDVVSLGRGGEIVLTFDTPVADGEGYDFAVFENAFTNTFLELAFVEVGSDGEHFIRFDNAYLGTEPVASYGTQDSGLVGSMAGKYRKGYGAPFDLAALRNRPEVLAGIVDLDSVTFIKIIDIIGDGGESDSFGNPIYDPYPTTDSAGFDLDAIGVLNEGD